MKILFFGDSNTAGYRIDGGSIEPAYPRIAADGLGSGARICVDAIPGRNAIRAQGRLHQDLKKLAPDVLVLMLGSNDCLFDPVRRTKEVADAIDDMLRDAAQMLPGMQILLINPPVIPRNQTFTHDPGASLRSRKLHQALEKLAGENHLTLLDADGIVRSFQSDRVHLDEAAHRALGEVIAREIKKNEE